MSKSKTVDLTSGPILKTLAELALPIMISSMLGTAYSIMDMAWIGLLGAKAVAGVGVGGMYVWLSQGLASLSRMGGQVNTAQACGRKDYDQARSYAASSLQLTALSGILFAAVCVIFIQPLLGFFNLTDAETYTAARSYTLITCGLILFSYLNLTLTGLSTAQGDSRTPLLANFIGLAGNIILDPLLIFGVGIFPEMGIRGAALATGLGQVFTVIVYLIAYKKCSIPVEISRKYLELNRNLDGKLYMVGIPAILNIALPSVLISFLNQILSAFSGSYVVVLGIYYKLQTFLYLPASGIVQGMRPLIGYNYGAGEIQRVKKLFGISVLLNGMIMLAGTIICFTVSETLMGMFTENPETVRLGTAALQIISIGFIPSAISVTASGALEGLSKGAQSLVISLLRYIIVIIPAAYLLCHFAGADAVWNAFWICEFITAVVVGIGIKYYWNRLLQ